MKLAKIFEIKSYILEPKNFENINRYAILLFDMIKELLNPFLVLNILR